MFCLRYFMHQLVISDRISFSFKHSSSYKHNIIKQLNYENKNLYGKLLETRNERRKSIGQTSNNICTVENSSETLTEPKDGTSNKKRGRKPKSSNVTDILSEASIPLLNVAHQNDKRTLSKKDIDVVSEETPKSTTKKKPASSSKSKHVQLPATEFVFKSVAVSIDDTNYPLENSGKIICNDSAFGTVLNYKFSDEAVKYCAKYPSVSKIMEETMSDQSRSILKKWQQNMINELGEEGFNKHFSDLKTRGHDFHSAVCNRVLGKPTDPCSEVTHNALKSLQWMLEHVSDPLAVESLTAHPTLEYKGIPDCVLHFRGTRVVVDWKLSDKPKKSLKDTYDAPVQITAYIGALNHDPNYKWNVNHGLVAVAYTNGDPCDVFVLAPQHCQIYWRHWLSRCDKFKARSHLHTVHDIDETSL